MLIKRLVIIVLVIFLAAAGVFTATTAASSEFNVRELTQVIPIWQQVNSNGFGDTEVGEVSALEPFNGYLYAGTYNPINLDPSLLDGAQIFRSPDGETWTPVTDPGFGNNHDTAPPAILDMAAFKGYLYASTGRGNAAQIWRSLDGVNWSRVVNAGFGDPDTVDFTALAVYNQALYIGATKQDSGAQIWRTLSGDGNLSNWTQVAPAVPMTDTAGVSGMAVFDDGSGTGLYAAVAYAADSPAQIWRSYGGDWEIVVSDGFGDSNTTKTGGMAVFAGDLYVGAGNTSSGAQLWRSSNGTAWVEVTPAFGDANNEKVEQVFVFQNQLYIGTTNTVTGIEIWRTADGSTWEQVNTNGFGDLNITTTNGSNASAHFLGQLYVGTSNVTDGGELWRMQRAYDLILSPDQEQSGPAGQTLTYTLSITNTGTMTGDIDLAAGGQTWTTTLSTASITQLPPSFSEIFTATVDIPPGAANQDMDTIAITATSQGDSGITSTVTLTTTVIPTLVCGITTDTPYDLGDIKLTITNRGPNLDCVRVTKLRGDHPNATTGIQTGQYWKIDGLQGDQTTAAAPGYIFNITLPHAIPLFENAKVCKFPGNLGGPGWDCNSTGADEFNVWRDAVTSGFSDWAVGVAGPTALVLTSFSVSSGAGQTAMVTIFFGMLVALTFAWKLWRSRQDDSYPFGNKKEVRDEP